jgi:kumamolisin
VKDIERAFHVTMQVYQHPNEAREFHAPKVEPSLDLAVRVLHISGLDNFTVPHPLAH